MGSLDGHVALQFTRSSAAEVEPDTPPPPHPAHNTVQGAPLTGLPRRYDSAQEAGARRGGLVPEAWGGTVTRYA